MKMKINSFVILWYNSNIRKVFENKSEDKFKEAACGQVLDDLRYFRIVCASDI